jgi:putative transcriptional regulator
MRRTGARPRAADGQEQASGTRDEPVGIRIHLDQFLVREEMTLTELSDQVGLTIANLSILKNGHARAIRFSTLSRLCEVLRCQPGDLLSYEPTDGRSGG